MTTATPRQPRVLGTIRRSSAAISPASRAADGMDLCLQIWVEWMGRSDKDLGIKAPSTLIAASADEGSDDTSQFRRDNEIAQATDAMIRSLKRSHQWAIRRRCGISKGHVWNFPQLDYIAEAQDACVELEKKLRANVATRLLW